MHVSAPRYVCVCVWEPKVINVRAVLKYNNISNNKKANNKGNNNNMRNYTRSHTDAYV